MCLNKRTPDQIFNDRRLIVKCLEMGGFSIQDITDKINNRYKKNGFDIKLSRQLINQDVLIVRKDMSAEYLEDVKQLGIEAIAHFNFIKKKALKDYDKSITEHFKEIEKEGYNDKFGTTKETIIEKEKLYGNPKFLDIAVKCEIEIAKIQGLYYKPESNKTEDNLSSLSDEELEKEIKNLDS